ncbi:MAG: hypothetical protein ACE5KK_04320 [Candidatus Brocadiales bacterium]
MKTLLKLIHNNKDFRSLLKDLKSGGDFRAGGLWGSSAAYLLSALAEGAPSWMLIITSSVEEAEEFEEDLNLFRPGTAAVFHPWEGFSTEKWRPSIQLPPNISRSFTHCYLKTQKILTGSVTYRPYQPYRS